MAKGKEVKVTKLSRIAVVEREKGLGPKNLVSQGIRVVTNSTINDKVNNVKSALLSKSSLKAGTLAEKEYELMGKFVAAKSEEEQVKIYQDLMQVQSEIASLELTTKAAEDLAKFLLEEVDFTETEE